MALRYTFAGYVAKRRHDARSKSKWTLCQSISFILQLQFDSKSDDDYCVAKASRESWVHRMGVFFLNDGNRVEFEWKQIVCIHHSEMLFHFYFHSTRAPSQLLPETAGCLSLLRARTWKSMIWPDGIFMISFYLRASPATSNSDLHGNYSRRNTKQCVNSDHWSLELVNGTWTLREMRSLSLIWINYNLIK